MDVYLELSVGQGKVKRLFVGLRSKRVMDNNFSYFYYFFTLSQNVIFLSQLVYFFSLICFFYLFGSIFSVGGFNVFLVENKYLTDFI